MSFRARLLLACVPLALAPLVVFGLRARAEVADQLGAQHRERVAALAGVIEEELEREAAEVGARLDRLAEAMAVDNRLRRAVLDRNGAERAYLLDYATRAMPLAGLDLLRLQDAEGRVLSSGHFRHEYETLDPELPAALRRADGRGVLVALPTASGSLLGLARARTVGVGARTVTIVGGTAVDDGFLDRLDVDFSTGRADELGILSRVLDRMTRRLRASAARLREAERRATIGDIARQVNHDLRNGLIPIRNVLDHLAGLARSRPEDVATVFLDRQGTLDSSLEYLDSLAANYARLSTRPDRRPSDVNAVARRVVDDLSGTGGDGEGRGDGGEDRRLDADLAPDLPPVRADPVALRRILENLVVNALESLDDGGGRVIVWSRSEDDVDPPRIAFGVTDTGPGIPAGERDRIFDDFYTTKPEGGGLGLSIVRRLVSDHDGRITVDSSPGSGTTITVELPAGASASAGARTPGTEGRPA